MPGMPVVWDGLYYSSLYKYSQMVQYTLVLAQDCLMKVCKLMLLGC